MEIQNASTVHSKSNQLPNVNTVRYESKNITNQPGEINDRKFEVIALVVNASINDPDEKLLCLKYLLCSNEVLLDIIYQEYVSHIIV